jgi:hypothetical protein
MLVELKWQHGIRTNYVFRFGICICQRYFCVIIIQALSMRSFQVVVDSSPAEKIALRTGSQYCTTSSPVSELHSLFRECGGNDIYVAELYRSGNNICKSVLCCCESRSIRFIWCEFGMTSAPDVSH